MPPTKAPREISSRRHRRLLFVVTFLGLWLIQFVSDPRFLLWIRSTDPESNSSDIHPMFLPPETPRYKDEETISQREHGIIARGPVKQSHNSSSDPYGYDGQADSKLGYVVEREVMSDGSVLFQPDIMAHVIQNSNKNNDQSSFSFSSVKDMSLLLQRLPYVPTPSDSVEQLVFLRLTKTASTSAILFLYDYHTFHKPNQPVLFPYPLQFGDGLSEKFERTYILSMACMFSPSRNPRKDFQGQLQQTFTDGFKRKGNGPVESLENEDPFYRMRNQFHSPAYQCGHVDYTKLLSSWALSLISLDPQRISISHNNAHTNTSLTHTTKQSYSLQTFTFLRDPVSRFPSFFRYVRAIYPNWAETMSETQKKHMLNGDLLEFVKVPQSETKRPVMVFQNAALHWDFEVSKRLITGPSPKVLPLVQECFKESLKLLLAYYPQFFFDDHQSIEKSALRARIDSIVGNYTSSEASPKSQHQVDRREQTRLRKYPEMKHMLENQTLTLEYIQKWQPKEYEIYEIAKREFQNHLRRYADMFTEEEIRACHSNLGTTMS